MMKPLARPLFIGSLLSILAACLFLHFEFTHPIVAFGAVFMVSSVLYVAMASALVHVEVAPRALYVLIVLSLFLRLSFVATSPIGSEDLYRYMWDGKVQASGLNPYLYTAVDPRLDSLRTSLLPSAINHADMKTIYFPLSQWVFYLSYVLSGEGVWGIKLMLLAAEVATVTGLLLLLRWLKIPAKYVLLYAVCPLSITQFAVDGHVDALGLPLLAFSLYSLLREKRTLSYILLGLSMSVKPVGLVLLPALFFNEKSVRGKLGVIGIPLATIGAQLVPYAFSSNPLEMLLNFTRNWSFNGVVFESLNVLFQNNQTSRLVCAALLGFALLLLFMKNSNFCDRIYFSVLALLLLSPVVHPWYVTWLAVLLPVARRWSGIAFAAGVSLTSFTVLNYRLHGVWEQQPAILAVEYLPVLAFLFMELRQARRGADAR